MPGPPALSGRGDGRRTCQREERWRDGRSGAWPERGVQWCPMSLGQSLSLDQQRVVCTVGVMVRHAWSVMVGRGQDDVRLFWTVNGSEVGSRRTMSVIRIAGEWLQTGAVIRHDVASFLYRLLTAPRARQGRSALEKRAAQTARRRISLLERSKTRMAYGRHRPYRLSSPAASPKTSRARPTAESRPREDVGRAVARTWRPDGTWPGEPPVVAIERRRARLTRRVTQETNTMGLTVCARVAPATGRATMAETATDGLPAALPRRSGPSTHGNERERASRVPPLDLRKRRQRLVTGLQAGASTTLSGRVVTGFLLSTQPTVKPPPPRFRVDGAGHASVGGSSARGPSRPYGMYKLFCGRAGSFSPARGGGGSQRQRAVFWDGAFAGRQGPGVRAARI